MTVRMGKSRRRSGKRFEDLTEQDFREHPVWQFTNDDAAETWMVPVEPLPAADLRQCVAATEITLSNGARRFATVSNVHTHNPRATKHFLLLDVFEGGEVFQLPQYHDSSYADRGPDALARFLGLPIDAVFPIRYDLTGLSVGDRGALVGVIDREPSERLGKAELIQLSME